MSQDYDKMTQDDLDGLVHDTKSIEASDINNAGRDYQIAYLNGEAETLVLKAGDS